MISRYYIRIGSYEEGEKYISKLKRINNNNYYNLLKANRQLVCIHMNRYDSKELGEVLEESFNLLSNMKKEEEGIWNRLKGYYYIMIGEYEKSRKLLFKSVKIFEESEESYKYAVNLAAAVNWIGETYRFQRLNKEAGKYYIKAIKLCEDIDILGGTPLFYANYGQNLYELGQIEESLDIFNKSILLYKKTDSIWGKSIPYSYRARIHFNQGNYKMMHEDILISIEYLEKLKSKYEVEILNKTIKHIRNVIKKEPNREIKNIYLSIEKFNKLNI